MWSIPSMAIDCTPCVHSAAYSRTIPRLGDPTNGGVGKTVPDCQLQRLLMDEAAVRQRHPLSGVRGQGFALCRQRLWDDVGWPEPTVRTIWKRHVPVGRSTRSYSRRSVIGRLVRLSTPVTARESR